MGKVLTEKNFLKWSKLNKKYLEILRKRINKIEDRQILFLKNNSNIFSENYSREYIG